MSEKSPTSSIHSKDIAADLLAAAAQRRAETTGAPPEVINIQEHELRQAFRRLIDPGILRPNSKEVAMASLKILLTISENLLREPTNPKFQQFKATNDTIKRRLIEPKGALEYAIALGFRPEVEDFQPYYRFNPRKMTDLRVGTAILKDALDLEVEKQERLERAKREEKAVAQAAANNVKLAFLDDRKTKMLRDQRDRERREARAAAAARAQAEQTTTTTSSAPSSPKRNMPGEGQSLLAIRPEETTDTSLDHDGQSD